MVGMPALKTRRIRRGSHPGHQRGETARGRLSRPRPHMITLHRLAFSGQHLIKIQRFARNDATEI
jgi:hypothetical protein